MLFRLIPCATAAILSILAAPLALAETSPYSVGLSTQRVHDSNVLRTAASAAQSDAITSIGLRFGLDQPIGRSRLHAAASFDQNRFNTLTALNNNGYRVDAGLDWTSADNWAGEFGADSGEQLFRYDLQSGTSAVSPSIQRTDHVFARARVGIVTRWTFEGGLEAVDQSYSLAAAQGRNQNWQGVQAGVKLQQTPDLSIKTSARLVQGKYPKLGTGDTYDRHEVQVLANWRVSGASALDTAVSMARESHSQQIARDATYWLGYLRWQWDSTAKTRLGLRLGRDSDAGSADIGVSITDVRVRDSAEFTLSYLPTAKTQVDAQVRYAQRNLDNSFIVTQGTSVARAADTTEAVALTATYHPIRPVDIGCTFSHERRSVSGANAGITYPYSANVIGCFGQLWWR